MFGQHAPVPIPRLGSAPSPSLFRAARPVNVPVVASPPVVTPTSIPVVVQPPQTPGYVAAAPVAYGGQRFRECKIHGKIMDPGEKDCMEYSSLVYQIESASRQGYPEADICAAIIRATFSKTLRAVLETRPGATLSEVSQILKAHFTVRKVRSVFLELGKIKQMKGETPFTYLMRAIALRETVTRMNREEDGELTTQLIQTQLQEYIYLFLWSVAACYAQYPSSPECFGRAVDEGGE